MTAGPAHERPSPKARRASAPYAHKTRGYFRTLSATSVGIEMAVSVVMPLMLGIWLDRKAGTAPWLMLLFLGFGFAAGIRAVWRYVAAADREARESEEEEAAMSSSLTSTSSTTPPAATPLAPTSPAPDDRARGGS